MVNSAYILIRSFVLLVLAVGWLTLHVVLLVLAVGWLTLRRMGYVIIRPRNELHGRLCERFVAVLACIIEPVTALWPFDLQPTIE
jgi:hypothetical protein